MIKIEPPGHNYNRRYAGSYDPVSKVSSSHGDRAYFAERTSCLANRPRPLSTKICPRVIILRINRVSFPRTRVLFSNGTTGKYGFSRTASGFYVFSPRRALTLGFNKLTRTSVGGLVFYRYSFDDRYAALYRCYKSACVCRP